MRSNNALRMSTLIVSSPTTLGLAQRELLDRQRPSLQPFSPRGVEPPARQRSVLRADWSLAQQVQRPPAQQAHDDPLLAPSVQVGTGCEGYPISCPQNPSV
jgi:hypothetical protein